MHDHEGTQVSLITHASMQLYIAYVHTRSYGREAKGMTQHA